jgi:uncharacterized membrane protein YcaP (DUF421 family)
MELFSLPLTAIAARSIIIYIVIVLGIRLFGKREVAQLSITDLVFILLISNSVQGAMVGPDTTLWGGIVAALALFAINYVFGTLFFKSKKFSSFIEGHPIMLVYNGKIIRENLNKAQISVDEIEAVVREHGVEKISDVNLAILEIDGNISVLTDDFKHKTVKHRRAHKVVEKTE